MPAALPGGNAAQRDNFKRAQQRERESAIWRQTASCICDNLALYWRQEAADQQQPLPPSSPGQPAVGLLLGLVPALERKAIR